MIEELNICVLSWWLLWNQNVLIVEDVITEFSMVREIEILSRQTCFNLRDKDLSNDKLRNEYGLDYVVSGSIRALEDRLRISVELAETVAGNVVWSNKYDRVKKDVFDIQDEIVRRITIALIGEIEISSLKRAHRKPTENITSYEFLLQGKNNHHKFTKHANEESRKNLDAAISADRHLSLIHISEPTRRRGIGVCGVGV